MSNYGRPPPNTEGMTSLKVDNIPYRTSMETLKHTFEKYGEVGDVYIPRDNYSKESRGFAFVRFYNNDEAEDAMDALDGKLLDGRELRVQMAKYGRPSNDSRSRRGPRRYSGGGGGSRGGRYGRSRSRSPDYRRRGRSNSRSRSRSPRPKNNKRYSRSASRSKSRSPVRRTSKSRSPVRRTSRSPVKRMSKSRSRSRSRSRS